VRRTLLLTALLAAYAALAFRGTATQVLRRGAFDPLLPLARSVEHRIGDKRFAEALPVALELQHAYPSEPLVVYWLAQIRHGLNDPSAEAEAWERYVAISPSPAEACPALPESYARQHRDDEALTAYEQCARFDADDGDLAMDLGDAYARAGRIADARAAFERAAQLDPDNSLVARRLTALRESAP